MFDKDEPSSARLRMADLAGIVPLLAWLSTDVSDPEKVDAIGLFESIKAAAAAGQARFTASLDASQRAAQEAAGMPARRVGQGIAAQVGLAKRDRRVTLRPAPDTMTRLSALLPVKQGVAAYAALLKAAEAARACGDARGRGQVMADTLVERVTGQATAEEVPVEVAVVMSDRTLLDGGEEPGHMVGYGPIPAGMARDLAGRVRWSV